MSKQKEMTEVAKRRKQKAFDKGFTFNKKVSRYYVDLNGFHTYVFEDGQFFKCRRPLPDRTFI